MKVRFFTRVAYDGWGKCFALPTFSPSIIPKLSCPSPIFQVSTLCHWSFSAERQLFWGISGGAPNYKNIRVNGINELFHVSRVRG